MSTFCFGGGGRTGLVWWWLLVVLVGGGTTTHAFVVSSSAPSLAACRTTTTCTGMILQVSSSKQQPQQDDDDDDDTTPATTTTTRSGIDKDNDSLLTKLQSVPELLDLQKFMDNAETIRANVFAGEFGQRGEIYVVAQVVVGLGVLVGGDHLPILDPILTVLGPLLLLVGAGVMVVSVQELGAALSPWPTTVVTDQDDLVTDGVLYGQVRHPIYAGLLAACVGLSLVTDSATRLLLTAALWYVLELKTEYEERDLENKFPVEYAKYQQTVPTKFVPRSLIEALPWHANDKNNSKKE